MSEISLHPRQNQQKRVRIYVLMGRGINPEGIAMNIRVHVQASEPQSAIIEAAKYYKEKGYRHINFDVYKPE